MTDTYSIGVDLGGTNLRVASYAGSSDFLDTISVPTRLDQGRDRVVRDMCEAIRALLRQEYGGRGLAGIGIGTPGPLELPEGILRSPPNLRGWNAFNLRQAVEDELKQSIQIESDANLAALAELRCGAGKTHSVESLCALTLGTGVGSGLILRGEIWHGATGMGGEAGHIVVHARGGASCGCGGSGCLEQYASASAVVRMAKALMGEYAPETSHELYLMAMAGHVGARNVFHEVGYALGIGLTSLINTLNLPLYLIGGGVAEAWELFAPAMFWELEERSYVYRLTKPSDAAPERLVRHKTYILRAELGSAAGLLGACLLPYQQTPDRRVPEEVFVH